MNSRWKAILQGRADKKIQGIYIVGTLVYYAILLITSIFLFEGGVWREQHYGPFTFLYTAISNLGNPLLNPRGWWVFSMGMIGTGILLIPQLRYLYYHIRTDTVKSAKLVVFFLSLTAMGLIGAGIINEQLAFPVHYFFGACVYGGLGLAAIYGFFFFIVRMVRRQKWPKPWQFALAYSVLLTACGFLFSVLFSLSQPGPHPLELVEWLMLVVLLGWLFWLQMILPRNNAEMKIEK
jgi:hypothetical membrane protein